VQKWEYLRVYFPGTKWYDSLGRSGEGVKTGQGWYHCGGLLNELGAQGWELTGVGGQYGNLLYFRRPGA
jgi:hypothetical protein